MPLRPAAVLLLALVGGCSAAPPAAPSQSSGPPTAEARVRVGEAVLQVELAVTPEQRERGLRGRDVPPGTGMVFRYDTPARVRFTMSRVDRPLVAVFARDGRAVLVEQMPPCPDTVERCPRYGPDEPVDVVVEAAPGSLPSARPGDPVVLLPS